MENGNRVIRGTDIPVGAFKTDPEAQRSGSELTP
jgi:hypothetical protein